MVWKSSSTCRIRTYDTCRSTWPRYRLRTHGLSSNTERECWTPGPTWGSDTASDTVHTALRVGWKVWLRIANIGWNVWLTRSLGKEQIQRMYWQTEPNILEESSNLENIQRRQSETNIITQVIVAKFGCIAPPWIECASRRTYQHGIQLYLCLTMSPMRTDTE